MSFCGATDTHVLDFWSRLPRILKPGWISFLVCTLSCLRAIPLVHLGLPFMLEVNGIRKLYICNYKKSKVISDPP